MTADLRVDAEGAAGSNVPLLRLFDSTGTRIVNVYRQNGSGKISVQHSGIYAATTATLPSRPSRASACAPARARAPASCR